MDQPVIRVGVLGSGTVGSSLISLVERQRPTIEARTGLSLEVVRVGVRTTALPRSVDLAPEVFTTDAMSVVTDPDVDVVVELIGGVEPARTLVAAALKAGKPVVSANKALLASCGAELFALADASGVDLLFEAAVAGGIPFVRPLRESLLGEPVHRVLGIMNGTTNFVLTRMTEKGTAFPEALAEAQALGYAEADPTADIEGYDAAAKLAIVASIAFGADVRDEDVAIEGIGGLTIDDMAFASRHGFVVKLLGVADRDDQGEISVQVYPALVPESHPLASVRESFNAIFVEGGSVGDLMFYGQGAGGEPTASAVLGDLIDAAVNLRRGTHASVGTLVPARFRPVEASSSAYYVSIQADDRPGVLAAVAGVFGEHGVSIASMEQEGLSPEGVTAPEKGGARLEFVTHLALERDLRATLAELRELDVVRRVGSVIRVVVPGGPV